MGNGKDDRSNEPENGTPPASEQTSPPPGREVVAPVQPLDVTGTRTILVGTCAWCVALVVMLALYPTLHDNGNAWWIWTCVAGVVLGLLGWLYCRRREHRLRDDAPVSG